MPSVTQGVTFDADTSCASMDDGLQARIHDPLWLMARQWQFGEFQGDNAGTAARVTLQAEQAPLSRYRPAGSATASTYSPTDTPLETLVEREPVAASSGRHLALLVEAGLHFLRLLVANGAATYRAAYRSYYALARPPAAVRQEWDDDALRTLDLVAGRIPDAVHLHQDLSAALGADGTGNGPLPAQPAIPAADQPKVRLAAKTWLQWFASQGFSPPAGAQSWNPERMEYAFAVAARTSAQEIILAAPEYHGGRLDWDTFVGRAGPSLGPPSASQTSTHHLLPAPVTYRGMPSSRLWAFEDGRVNLGAVDSTSADLASLVLIEFALIYGNDWFLAPLEVTVGSLCRLNSLVVADSFGVTTAVPHYSQVVGASAAWRMYALSPEDSAANTPWLRESLFLAPTLAATLESPAIEEVLFLRDEMANMAWAVERVVQGKAGRPLNRFERYQAGQLEELENNPPGDEGNLAELADLVYRLGSTVPDYWIPLLPEEETTPADQLSMRLRRAAMPRFGSGGVVGSIPPLGALLRPGQPLALYEEEVPREGARVSRTLQFGRWINGSRHLWIGARKRPGRGEGSSGLRFDTAERV